MDLQLRMKTVRKTWRNGTGNLCQEKGQKDKKHGDEFLLRSLNLISNLGSWKTESSW